MSTFIRIGIALAAILFISVACNLPAAEVTPAPVTPVPATPDTPVPTGSEGLSAVETWGYQLQGYDLAELAASEVDLLVIDAANDDGEPFTAGEIAQIKTNGKLVLAYLSIGEAETYRAYWNPAWVADDSCTAALTSSAPEWLAEVNPEWCGNYLVQYWHPEWESIVMTMLDGIMAAGFDGVYLDKVDSYYTWLGEEDLGAPFANPDAPTQMAALIEAIAEHTRADHPDFMVVPQNGTEIIEYLDAPSNYLALINGIGVEDTFFYPAQGEEENAPYSPQQYVIGMLDRYQQAGVPVFAIDYVTDADKIEQFYEAANQHGYIPYAGVRALDRLMPQP